MPLIVIEGVDGAGKSTQAQLLAERLRQEGARVEHIHFPRLQSPVYGELIAAFLRGEFGDARATDPRLIALLYAGDRAAIAPQLHARLGAGEYILCDRYYISNLAYQGAKVQAGPERETLIDWILRMELEHFAIPPADQTIFLDVPPAFTQRVLTERAAQEQREYLRGQHDVHERDADMQAEVRRIFLQLERRVPRFHRIVCTDGQGHMRAVDDIAAELWGRVRG
ncbi:MAG: dTMP kinase [Bacteroidia bacterium]|nr:MAG: dTMP kinase [Bacteroidia bacterium]